MAVVASVVLFVELVRINDCFVLDVVAAFGTVVLAAGVVDDVAAFVIAFLIDVALAAVVVAVVVPVIAVLYVADAVFALLIVSGDNALDRHLCVR